MVMLLSRLPDLTTERPDHFPCRRLPIHFAVSPLTFQPESRLCHCVLPSWSYGILRQRESNNCRDEFHQHPRGRYDRRGGDRTQTVGAQFQLNVGT